MFNELKVDDNVNIALQNAGTIALGFGVFQIGTEHLLYGLSTIEGTAKSLLSAFGVTSALIENTLARTFSKTNATILNNKIDLTPQTKEIFLVASQFATQIGSDCIVPEHLLVSLLHTTDCYAVNLLKKNFKVNINDIKANLMQLLKAESITSAVYNSSDSSSASVEHGSQINSHNKMYGGSTKTHFQVLPEKLYEMGQDLTAKARSGKIGPIIGRDEETARMIEILCRKTKNNPVLIGEAGVGKSAVVEGLALAIANGEVPDILKDKIIFSFEIGNLMSGTKFRGALEEKLKNIIDIITNSSNILVFIDEIHTLMQAGGDKGEVSPADMLKPYLSRGEMQTIGATTTDEYKRFIEKDKAMERRFQPVYVNPPSVEDTIKILQGLRQSFENFHNVIISDEAIVAAVELSDRYIMDRNLPDKAIDLIDESSSRAKVFGAKKPQEIINIEKDLNTAELIKQDALNNEDYIKAGEMRERIMALMEEKQRLLQEFKNKNYDEYKVIGHDNICEIISDWTKIPVTKLNSDEKDKLLNLENILHRRVVGQVEAVSAVSKAIRRNRLGIRDKNRPIGSFMFLGQSGVGKTELCKALSEAMFDNEDSLIRLDMSEYMERQSVSKLIGSPPGYVGYDEGGQLTERVRRNPYSIILFDEIEKAHPDVYNLLLQVLDDGRLTDSQGRVVHFKNAIIIFTSNIGVSKINQGPDKSGYAFMDESDQNIFYQEMKNVLIKEYRSFFKPEFINRIDVVTVFHPLNIEQLSSIAKIFISRLNKRLIEQNINLKVTESALMYIIHKGYDSELGGRPLRRLIEQEIEDKIAEEILLGNIRSGTTLIISAKEGFLSFRIEN